MVYRGVTENDVKGAWCQLELFKRFRREFRVRESQGYFYRMKHTACLGGRPIQFGFETARLRAPRGRCIEVKDATPPAYIKKMGVPELNVLKQATCIESK